MKELYLFELVYSSQELLNHRVSYQEIVDVDFDLIKNYLRIHDRNKLYTNATIDRDMPKLVELSGLIKAWVKVYYRDNPSVFSFFPVNQLYKSQIIVKIVN